MFSHELHIKTCDISTKILSQIKKFDRSAELSGRHENSIQNILQFNSEYRAIQLRISCNSTQNIVQSSKSRGSAKRHAVHSQLAHYKSSEVNRTTVCTMHSEKRARNCNAEYAKRYFFLNFVELILLCMVN